MAKKCVIVVGAGSTLSDAVGKPLKRRPPLDHGFFAACGQLGWSEQFSIVRYLQQNYDIDPTQPEHDSLERMMAIIYADINHPSLQSQAIRAFRTLIRLFNRRIAETTNSLSPTNRCNLYRIISKLLKEGVSPEHLTLVTFNQDLQIEKVLQRLESTKAYSKLGDIFSFPACYALPDADGMLTKPPTTVKQFKKCAPGKTGIRLLKLHGSLNWFSSHTSRNVPKGAILNPRKEFRITPRAEIPVNMTYSGGKRTTYAFPLIVPPVNHKAAIIHQKLHPVWRTAESVLKEADEIIVFGYSCPQTDFESANLLRRAARSGADPSSFVVIDPNPKVFQRYVNVTNLNHLSYFRSAETYIQKG